MSEIWNLERDLCRCCHAEGVFNNLSKPRESNGLIEIYSNMLKACFKIVIDSVPGQLNKVTYKICETCIQRLRDAYEFMKQVQNCEIKFKDYYKRNAIQVSDNDSNILNVDQDSFPDTNEDSVVPIKSEEDAFFTDYKNYSLDDNLLDIEHEDAIKSATKPKDKRKTKKVKHDKEVTKVINKLIKANVKKDDKTIASEDDEVLALINFTSLRNENGVIVHNCNICKKNYATKGAFTKHYRQVHLNLRKDRRQCHLCEETVSKYTKAFHLEAKHNIPAPTCNVCGKKFAFPHEVIRHQRYQHMGEKSFRCEECGKYFGSRILLKNHLISHSTIRDFICKICGKAFKTETALRLHVRVHLNVKPYACNICDKAFTEKGTLRCHKKKKHSDDV